MAIIDICLGAALPAFEKNVSGPLGRQLCVNWAGEAGSGQEPAGPNSASSDSTKNAKEMQEGVLKKPKVAPTKEEGEVQVWTLGCVLARYQDSIAQVNTSTPRRSDDSQVSRVVMENGCLRALHGHCHLGHL